MAENRTTWDNNFNVIVPVLIAISLIANIIMWSSDVAVGQTYTLLMLLFIAAYVFVLVFFKGETVSEKLMAPFTVSNKIAAASFLFGWVFLVGLEITLNVVGNGFSITRFSVPLQGQQLAEGVFQSFSAAQIGNNMSWTIFNIVWNAGTTEELVFTVGMFLLGAIFAIFVLITLFQRTKKEAVKSELFIVVFATIFASSFFTLAHVLNSSYTGIMFLIAFLFKAATIWGVYRIGLFLSFLIGIHQANNFIWLVQQYGWNEVLNGLFGSVIGIIQIVIFSLIVFYAFVNFQDIVKEVQEYIGTLKLF